jgi:hypothetical protein
VSWVAEKAKSAVCMEHPPNKSQMFQKMWLPPSCKSKSAIRTFAYPLRHKAFPLGIKIAISTFPFQISQTHAHRPNFRAASQARRPLPSVEQPFKIIYVPHDSWAAKKAMSFPKGTINHADKNAAHLSKIITEWTPR